MSGNAQLHAQIGDLRRRLSEAEERVASCQRHAQKLREQNGRLFKRLGEAAAERTDIIDTLELGPCDPGHANAFAETLVPLLRERLEAASARRMLQMAAMAFVGSVLAMLAVALVIGWWFS